MYRDFLAILTGAIVSLMLLICLHLALYPHLARGRGVPWPYIVGCLALGIGIIVTSAMSDQWFVAVTYWSILIPGGLAIIVAWRVRRWLERRDKTQRMYDRILRKTEEALHRGVSRESPDQRN